MLGRIVIGAPLHRSLTSEVIPVAPRADVRAPLVMERLLPSARSEEMLAEAAALGAIARELGPPWQRLISSDFGGYDAQYIYERFVGVTLRDVSHALRTSGRVLPMDVLRAIAETIFEGLAPLARVPPRARPLLLTDLSVGLGIDGAWHFAVGGLNQWLTDVVPPDIAGEPEYDGNLSPDSLFFLSPEAISGRPETPGSVATRAALLLWQLVTGGFHPYRGGRYEMFPSLTRYSRSEVRVPVELHPHVGAPLAAVLAQGVRFSGDRFPDLQALQEALAPLWPEPRASPQRTFDVICGLCWPVMQRQLQALRREPLLPIHWDGVWPSSRTPEEGLAVLEDQLLERLVAVTTLPARGELPEAPPPDPAATPSFLVPARPRVNLAALASTPASATARRVGLLARLLAFFGR